jgi:aryl-alcohol dehydrogenase-like predicted oxidoreductase
MTNTCTHTILGRTGLEICRLGLSATYRPGTHAVHTAVDAGINYLFCYGFDTQMTGALREVFRGGRRDRMVVSTGAYNLLVGHPNLRRTLERRLKQLATDYIDVFLFLGVMKPEHLRPRVLDEMRQLREEGKVRAIGVSCHDRRLVGQLAADGAIDVAMMRYNAAHRGAEQDIFPHVALHQTGVVSYTATRWRYLLRRPRHYPVGARIPSAGECYRFVLSNPAVHVCLTAPSNEKQLAENLAALQRGPLPPEDMSFMREFGDLVHEQNHWFM